jgi:hypothetical protein
MRPFEYTRECFTALGAATETFNDLREELSQATSFDHVHLPRDRDVEGAKQRFDQRDEAICEVLIKLKRYYLEDLQTWIKWEKAGRTEKIPAPFDHQSNWQQYVEYAENLLMGRSYRQYLPYDH